MEEWARVCVCVCVSVYAHPQIKMVKSNCVSQCLGGFCVILRDIGKHAVKRSKKKKSSWETGFDYSEVAE